MFVHTDYHTHTMYSHGRGTVEQNVEAAVRKGLFGVGISDHGPANLFGVGVRSTDVFTHIRREVELARLRWPGISIFLGVEANVISTDGHLDVPIHLQDRFDYVQAGLHPLVRPLSATQFAGLGLSTLIARCTGNRKRAKVLCTDALIAAVYRNRVHVITHPGYRLPVDTRALARACAQTGTFLEINAGHEHISVEYIEIAAREGARFVIGSDAHTPERVGDFTRALHLAKLAGLTTREVVNAVEEAPEKD